MYISSACAQAVTMTSWVEVACASAHQIRHPAVTSHILVISDMKGQGFGLGPTDPIHRYELAYTHKKTRQMARQKRFFELVMFLCAHAIHTDVVFTRVWDGDGG